MFKKSINTVMIIFISLVVFVTIGIIVIYIMSSSQKMVLGIQKNSLNEVATSITKICTDFFEEGLLEAKSLASRRDMLTALQGGDKEEARKILADSITFSKEKIAIAILFNMQGEIVTGINIKGTVLTKKDSGSRKYSAGVIDGKDVFVSPYLIKSKLLNKLLGSIGVAVKDGSGKIVGGIAILLNFDVLFDRHVLPLHFGKGGYAFILDDKGRMLAHQDKTIILNDFSQDGFGRYALKHKNGSLDYTFKGVDKCILFREVPSVHWLICLTANHAELTAGAVSQRNVLLGVGLVAIVVIVFAFSFISRRLIFEPLSRIAAFVNKVSHGEYQTEVEGTFKYELVALADDIKTMVAEIKNRIGFSEGTLNAITTPCAIVGVDGKMLWANKDSMVLVGLKKKPEDIIGWTPGKFFFDDESKPSLSNKSIEEERQLTLDSDYINRLGEKRSLRITSTPFYDLDNKLLGSFSFWLDLTDLKEQQLHIEAQNKKIAETAKDAFAMADQMAGVAEELSAQIEQSSRGADVQRQRVQETATAMEEMNATVLEVAQNASGAAEGSDTARSKAEQGQKIVENTIEAITQVQEQAQIMRGDMGTLGQQAEDIGNVMNVISDIADQTNLLALNAAIEAARAGEAGRGFAVVADEVRKLAEKTMSATKEVGEAINSIQQGTRGAATGMGKAVEVVEAATALAGQSGDALREIVSLVDTASDQVRSIATASEEQSATSEEINRSVDEINRISTETAGAMEESSRAVAELAQLAQELNQLIRDLQDA